MQETLITFETAKLAKEKGFNIPTIPYFTPKGYCFESEGYQTERLEKSNWNNGQGSYPTLAKEVKCSAPTQSLLQKWLREVHNIHIDIPYMDEVLMFGYKITTIADNTEVVEIYKYNLYEEALEFGLQEALKLIKQ